MHLIACPQCARQYDVTHLLPDSKVRCICDAILAVGRPRTLSVAGLRCSHCGGAVGAGFEACPYCEVELSARDRRETTVCPACYARIDDDSKHCSSCGVAIDPRALIPIPAGRSCPRCTGELRIRSLGRADVIECGDCEGIWLGADIFDAVCRDAERNLESSLTARGCRRAASEQHARYIPCLICEQLMLRRQYLYGKRSSGIIVDYCRDPGIWLDSSELENIVAFIRPQGSPGSALGASELLASVQGIRPSRPTRTHRPAKLGARASGRPGDPAKSFVGRLLDLFE